MNALALVLVFGAAFAAERLPVVTVVCVLAALAIVYGRKTA